jgi:ribose 5-phosphate isomerase A
MSEQEKADAARAAAQLVRDGQLVGLGTGTTVAHLLPALTGIERLDIAIDGADQIDADGWLVKGGGGAHTREKVVAAAAARFVVIASSEKAVARIGPPIPLELLRFGADATLGSLGEVRLRPVPPSPDGGLIADYLGSFGDPAALTARLDATPGVVGHGIFPPALTADILLAANGRVEHRVLR